MIEAITLTLRSLCTILLIGETSIGCSSHRPAADVSGTQSLKNWLTEPWLQLVLRPRLMGHRFPAKLEMLILSKVTSAGRESAYATALATSSGEIILWRGHFPSI